jgi:hypothetical protein
MDWLNAGMALSRMLLTAQAENVWSSFLNQPIEVPELRPKVQELVKEKKGFAQILLRMGYGKDVEPTPRRPIDDILLNVSHRKLQVKKEINGSPSRLNYAS